jgi:hypothetical protein
LNGEGSNRLCWEIAAEIHDVVEVNLDRMADVVG